MLRKGSASETHTVARRLSQTMEGLEIQLLSGFSNPLRRSFTADPRPSYQNSYPNASTSAIPSIYPIYGRENDELPPSRFKILPREEEGREELPPYTCSLHREAMFERKMELRDRKLYAVQGNGKY